MYPTIETDKINKMERTYKFTPETKTRLNQTDEINNVCPMSGWRTSKNKTGVTIKVLSKNLKLLSQKIIFNDFLVNYSDQKIKKDHKNIYKYVLNNSSVIRKIFNLNLSQSLVMDGDRIITIEDIFGTNNMINKFKNLNKQFKNLIFIKSVKKDQINEIDFPIIGNETLDLLIKFNFKAICLINKNIIIANKSSFIKNINKSKLSLIVI